MAYNSSPFTDADYYSTFWLGTTIDISTLNPDSDPNLLFSLDWGVEDIVNGEYAEVRVDIIDTDTSTVIIEDIKKYTNGDVATFTLGTSTNIQFKIKIYTHKSFVINIKVADFTFDNKVNIITNSGDNMLLDVIAYDDPNYSPVSLLKLGTDQTSYQKDYTTSDFEAKDLGTTGVIYDNPDIVWEDLYTDIPHSHESTASALDVTNNKLYAFGDVSTDYDKLAVLDIDTDAWTSLTATTVGAGNYVIGAQYYSGSVYYITTDGSTTNKWYEYSVSGDSHTLLKTETAGYRNECTTVLYGDVIYMMGGSEGLDNIVTYDIGADTISTSTDCSLTSGAKTGGRAAIYDGDIYFMGGSSTSSLYIYDISGDSWSAGTSMPSVKSFFGCVSTYNRLTAGDDIIYAVGGQDATGTKLNVVEAYDTSTDTWVTKNDTSFNNTKASCVTDGYYLYNVGGTGTNLDTKVWRYEPEPVSLVLGADYSALGLHDRIKLGTARLGDVTTTALETDYLEVTIGPLDTDTVSVYGWTSNNGSTTTNIGSIGFFNQDSTKQMFSYSKINFDFNPTYDYKVVAKFKIESADPGTTTIMNNTTVGFLDRVFQGPYVSDYTYISKFLAGENTGNFLITDETMDSEHYGPVSFKSVTIDTGSATIKATGNIPSASGNGNDYDAFAMLCEEPGTLTNVNTASFTDPTDPFTGTGAATLTYVATPLAGDLAMVYSLEVDINSLYLDFEIAAGTSAGKVELITYNGSAWAVDQILVDDITSAVEFKHKLVLDTAVEGVGLRFTAIDGDITVNDIYHAGNTRKMAYGTKINIPITKTVDYNILVDMVEDIE